MKIGTVHTLHWIDGRGEAESLAKGTERMIAADEMNYYSAWMTEHHFLDDQSYRPYEEKNPTVTYDLGSDPLTLLAYVAGRTRNLRLGTAVAVPEWDSPIRLAEQAATLDVLSGGRVDLGIGRGGGLREPTFFGVPTDVEGSRRRYREGLQVMLMAWAGEPVKFKGEFFDYDVPPIVPRPLNPPFPTLYLGSNANETLEFAAKNNMSYVSASGTHRPTHGDAYKERWETFCRYLGEAGRDPKTTLTPHVIMMYYRAPTDEEAYELAARHVVEWFVIVEGHYQYRLLSPGRGAGLPNVPNATVKDLGELGKKMVEMNIIGSPDTCIAKVREFCNSFDLNYLLAFCDFGKMEHEEVLRSMELFATRVAPHFTD